jgi:hypothetical protein
MPEETQVTSEKKDPRNRVTRSHPAVARYDSVAVLRMPTPVASSAEGEPFTGIEGNDDDDEGFPVDPGPAPQQL